MAGTQMAGVRALCRRALQPRAIPNQIQARLGAVASADSAPSEAARATWAHYAEVQGTQGAVGHTSVNRRYRPPYEQSHLNGKALVDNSMGQMSEKHWKDEWSEEELKEAIRDNVLMTWTPNSARVSLPVLVRAEGIYLYDKSGKQYMDMTSQAVCANMGFTVPEDLKKAIMKQMSEMPYVYSGMGMTEVRARLCSLMAEITPGDINGFFFPLGGAEANEGAIRIARRYTGKFKVMSAMRSYHGGTAGPLAATGDFRKSFTPVTAGYVKIMNPHPLCFSPGDTDESASSLALRMLEEQILTEGPETIATILLETVVGSSGVLLPPVGYLEGVRSLCDKYGILLILDEVMSGFFRTGPLFAFQHFPGVVPDILTSAKGLTSSFLPLGMIGIRQHIMDYFETNPIGWGATYANHPVLLACAYHVIRSNIRNRMHEQVAKIESVMLEEINYLVEKHPSVLQGRVIGAFGCLDLVNREGKTFNKLGDALPPEADVVKQSMIKRGLIGFFRSPMMHICPALIINEVELRELFSRIDGVLDDLEMATA